MNDERYREIGGCLGYIPAIIAFFSSWWYCTATYGYLLGFGLGWIPSIILAAIVFFGIMFLWPIVVCGILLLAFEYLRQENPAPPKPAIALQSSPDVNASSYEPLPDATSTSQWSEPLATGATFAWRAKDAPDEVYRQVGPLAVTISKHTDTYGVAPIVNVQAGAKSVLIKGNSLSDVVDHSLSAIEIDKGQPPVVMLQSFGGGAHCCNDVSLAGFFAGKLKIIKLGEFDGDRIKLPKDISGDGVADFVVDDDNFLYAFASYASSRSPPRVLNVVKGKIVDVSSRAAFRKLYLQDMDKSGATCRNGDNGDARNGSCPAFLADAARVGKLNEAWPQMLAGYDPDQKWDLPSGCIVKTRTICPGDAEIHFKSYPDALLSILKDGGYISRDWEPPKLSD